MSVEIAQALREQAVMRFGSFGPSDARGAAFWDAAAAIDEGRLVPDEPVAEGVREVGHLKRISLDPDDVLVLQLDPEAPISEITEMTTRLKAAFPGHRVAVLERGLSLGAVAEPKSGDVDTSTTGGGDPASDRGNAVGQPVTDYPAAPGQVDVAQFLKLVEVISRKHTLAVAAALLGRPS